MRIVLLVIIASTAMLVGGLALAGLPSPLGGVGVGLAMVGIAGFGVFLVYSDIKAARNGVGDAYNPGRAWRETRAAKPKDRKR